MADNKGINAEKVVEELKNFYRAYIITNNYAEAELFRYAAMLIEQQLSASKWNYIGDRPPNKDYPYLVYVHAPDDIQNTILDIEDENGEPIDWGFITMARFNKKQGGIWETEYDRTPYGSDLSKIDTANDYYISHWMPMPDKPKE